MTDQAEALASPPVEAPILFAVLDANNVVTSCGYSNMAPEGATLLDDATFAQIVHRVGLCTLRDGIVAPYAPPAAPTPTPVAVSKLGLVRALIASGQWNAVWTALNADPLVLAQWNAASQIALADPLTQSLIAGLSLTSDQVAALMTAAVSQT